MKILAYDVIVIGGGPSGLMAAIAAGEEGARVLLVDKGSKLGRKLAISGGGRCNVTNRKPVDEIIQHIPGNGRFLYSAFSVYNNENIIEFFEGLGIALKEEDHGRMFPVNDQAQSVVDAMLKRLDDLNVERRVNTKVADVLFNEEKEITGILLQDGKELRATSVVIAVGGKSVPQTGSTGDGYPWAERAGHTITTLFPTEVPLTSSEPYIRNKSLQGLALRDVAVSVLNKKGRPVVTHQMDMLFTHFGLSGPAILRCSQYVVKEQWKREEKEISIKIDSMPSLNEEQVFQEIRSIQSENEKKAAKNALKGLVPERYLLFLLEHAEIDTEAPMNTISQERMRALAGFIKGWIVLVDGTLSIEKAFVTGGGVSVKEVFPKTMGSKFVRGLYFCGEVLDLHGYTGGYNITSALVTGKLAGMNAGQLATLGYNELEYS